MSRSAPAAGYVTPSALRRSASNDIKGCSCYNVRRLRARLRSTPHCRSRKNKAKLLPFHPIFLRFALNFTVASETKKRLGANRELLSQRESSRRAVTA